MKVTQSDIDSVVGACSAAGYNAASCGRTIISRVCGISEKKARHIQTILRLGLTNPQPSYPTLEAAAQTSEDTTATFDKALEAYHRWIGMSKPVYTQKASDSFSQTQKILVAGDFHCPFHHREALKALVEEESESTDLLVIDGDLGDFWSTSRFPKNKRLTDPRSEMAETQAVLTLLASRFKRIKLFGGNHDERPQKYLTSLLPTDILDYIRLTGPMVFKPLEFMAAGLENVEIVEPIRTEFAEFAFLYQIGDLVCTHAETYSIIPNRATGNVNKWLHSFAVPAGVVNGPVRAVVQAHTHQGGTVLGDYGTLCIEGGCMSTLQDYHGTPKIMTPRPLAQGWSVVYQNNGVTCHRTSRFVPFKG